LQASYGLAQRGGVQLPYASEEHNKRLISDVNILTSIENKHLIFRNPFSVINQQAL